VRAVFDDDEKDHKGQDNHKKLDETAKLGNFFFVEKKKFVGEVCAQFLTTTKKTTKTTRTRTTTTTTTKNG